jgi:beta-lactamase regulating signal transducer with metallopeptidase domain
MNALILLLAKPWAEQLGWTLLHFLWQGTAIAILFAAARPHMNGARPRYLLGCVALAAMVAAPAATFAWLGGSDVAQVRTAVQVVAAPAAIQARAASTSPVDSALPWLVMAWFAGVAVFSTRLAGGWLSAARLRFSGARPAPAEWQETLARLASRMGVPRPVRLMVSARVEAPAVLGWLRPVVLAPVGALTGLPSEHVEALLAHELAHILRNDYLVNLFQGLAEAVLFYHPAVWWVSKQIRAERELCCDDLAVAASGDVLTYARALEELERCRPSRMGVALAASGGSLMHRIARLVEPSLQARHTLPGPGAAWALSFFLLMAVAAVAVRAQQPVAGGPHPTVDRSSVWIDKVKFGDVPIEVRGLGRLTTSTTVELKIAAPQAKDIQVGYPAKVDFRSASFIADGRVTRVAPDVQNGVVTVEVQTAEVPAGVARSGAIVDGVIRVGGMTNVVYVGRPVMGQADHEGTLYRLDPDGSQAVRVTVLFGRSSVQSIEVRSGLQPGDSVIVSDMSKYKDAERVFLK